MQEVKQDLPTGSVTAALAADAITPQAEIGPDESLTAAQVSAATPIATMSINGRPAKPATSADKSKIGRNDPCWCGSGKKYKSCHWPN
jgi:preprotein translocase subunit SecA